MVPFKLRSVVKKLYLKTSGALVRDQQGFRASSGPGIGYHFRSRFRGFCVEKRSRFEIGLRLQPWWKSAMSVFILCINLCRVLELLCIV